MRPRGVVVGEPVADEPAGLIEIDEQTLVEKCVRYLHAAVLGLPVVQRGFRDAVLARQIGRLRSGLVLAQNRDDLSSVNRIRFIVRPL